MLGEGALLVIDEIQKVPNWSETLKALWDGRSMPLRVLLLGSSALRLALGASAITRLISSTVIGIVCTRSK